MIKHFPEIFKECVQRIKPTANILNIVDNLNNTYTFTIDKFSNLLFENQSIKIENTTGFNTNVILIFNLNSINKTFDIKLQTGIIIPANFGTFTANSPFDYFSLPIEFAQKISKETAKKLKDIEQYPVAYLVSDFSIKDLLNNNFEIQKLTYYLINRTKSDKTTPERYVSEYPYLFNFYIALRNEFFKHKNINHINFNFKPELTAQIDQNEEVTWFEVSINCDYSIKTC
jgi:hypothetical protein